MVKNNDSGEENRRGIFRRLMARPFLVLGWIAAGIACLLLAVFVFYLHRNAPMSLLSDLKTGPKVFRTKIPEEMKIAQNLFRKKIQAVAQPVKPPTKMESMPPVEKKAVPSQPIVESLEISEPQQETEHSVSSKPTVAPSEQRELPEKVDLRQAEVRPQPVKEDVIEKTEERIIHREKWLLSQEPSFYTIQLMGARKEALLFNFVEKNQLLEQNEIAYYQTTFKEKAWFQLLYGVYAIKKDAQSAADNLPLKIRKSSPWIRRLSAVQKAIRRKAAQQSPGGTKKEHRIRRRRIEWEKMKKAVYPNLFKPMKLKGLRLKNRITMAPLYLGYAASGGTGSPLLLYHYKLMAQMRCLHATGHAGKARLLPEMEQGKANCLSRAVPVVEFLSVIKYTSEL